MRVAPFAHGLITLLAAASAGLPVLEAAAETIDAVQVPQADKVLIVKSERKLYLLRQGNVIKTAGIVLGLMPNGHKEREGDFRTPEGQYFLDARNPESDYFLSVKISYPNERDRARAKRLGVDPGGQIMIHGQPNAPKFDERRYEGWDWTDGCIAVSNSDMVDIWLMTREMIPIEIRP